MESSTSASSATPLLVNQDDSRRGLCSNFYVLAFSLFFVSLLEVCLQKSILTVLFNYRWFFGQFLCLLTCISLGILNHIHRDEVTEEMREVSKLRFGLMALLDTLHSMFLSISIGVLPAPVAILLPQFLIPITSLSNVACSPDRWVFSNFIAFVTSSGGISMVLISLLSHWTVGTANRPYSLGQAQLVWNTILALVAAFPAVLSAFYKASFLQKTRMSMHYMNLVTAVMQLCLGFVLSPLLLQLQYVGLASTVPDSATGAPAQVAAGFKCLFAGVDSWPLDRCHQHSTFLLVSLPLYLFAVVAAQIFSVWLLERGISLEKRAGQLAANAWPQFCALGAALVAFYVLSAQNFRDFLGDNFFPASETLAMMAAPVAFLGFALFVRDSSVVAELFQQLTDDEIWSTMEIAIDSSGSGGSHSLSKATTRPTRGPGGGGGLIGGGGYGLVGGTDDDDEGEGDDGDDDGSAGTTNSAGVVISQHPRNIRAGGAGGAGAGSTNNDLMGLAYSFQQSLVTAGGQLGMDSRGRGSSINGPGPVIGSVTSSSVSSSFDNGGGGGGGGVSSDGNSAFISLPRRSSGRNSPMTSFDQDPSPSQRFSKAASAASLASSSAASASSSSSSSLAGNRSLPQGSTAGASGLARVTTSNSSPSNAGSISSSSSSSSSSKQAKINNSSNSGSRPGSGSKTGSGKISRPKTLSINGDDD